MTHPSYAIMLELGLAALESDEDLDPCLVERLRQRFEALVAADRTAAELDGSVVRFQQRRP